MKDAKAFKKRVEDDELSFKPIGKRIGQYGRRLVAPATSKGKGKASEDGKAWESCEPDAEGAVVYEAWTVSLSRISQRLSSSRCRPRQAMPVSKTCYGECRSSSYSTSKLELSSKKTTRTGSLSFCMLVPSSFRLRADFPRRYEKRKRPSPTDESQTIDTYHFAGYSSIYSFLHYPDQVRLRLSQFIILPPFQGAGHGCECSFLN